MARVRQARPLSGLAPSTTLMVAAAALLLLAAPRPAQAHPHAVPLFHRGGLTVGFALGGGLISADPLPLSGGGWLSFRIGGIPHRRIGILLDHEILFAPAEIAPDQQVFSFAGAAAFAVQIYLDPAPLWLKLGGGLGYHGGDGFSTNLGGAVVAGVGFELLKVRHRRAPWALSLETQVVPLFLKAQPGNPSDVVIVWTAGLGLQWY